MGKRFDKDYFKHLRENSANTYDSIPALNWGENVNGEYKMVDRYYFVWKATTLS